MHSTKCSCITYKFDRDFTLKQWFTDDVHTVVK